MLNITTRQGLYKIVKNFNVEVKKVGDGLANLYSKQDIERYMIEHKEDRCIPKKSIKAVKKQKKTIEKLKNKVVQLKEETKKIVNTQIEENLDEHSVDLIENPLNKVGMAEYERVTKLLQEQGTYKDVDRSLVLAYAISYQKYIFAVVASGKEDDTFMDSYSNLKLHPYFLVAKESFSQMEKMAKLLGIGCRSRVGLEVNQPKKESIFDILNAKEEF